MYVHFWCIYEYIHIFMYKHPVNSRINCQPQPSTGQPNFASKQRWTLLVDDDRTIQKHWWFVKQYLRSSDWTSTSCISYFWTASV